jgi:hypothetical protein
VARLLTESGIAASRLTEVAVGAAATEGREPALEIAVLVERRER